MINVENYFHMSWNVHYKYLLKKKQTTKKEQHRKKTMDFNMNKLIDLWNKVAYPPIPKNI